MDISIDAFVEFAVQMSDWHELNEKHDARVMGLALEMAAYLPSQFDSARLLTLRHAARLHDIGRVGVRHDVMSFRGRWIDSDRAAGREHAMIGYKLLNAVPALAVTEIPLAVKYHHENWDGTGYPDALRGEAIPIMSRIIRVVDEWDALRSKRPYRSALAYEDAVHIMELDRLYFDPTLFPIFMKIVTDGAHG